MKYLVLIALAFIQVSAHAGNIWENIIDDEINRLRTVNTTSARYSDLNAPKSCKEKYKALYHKGKLKIVYGFGYGDTDSGWVIDYSTYRVLRSRLLQKCGPDTYLCGFIADKKDPDLLRKAEQDSTGESNYLVEIKLIHGSLTANDAFNVSPEKIEEQKAYCKNATDSFFYEVAKGADIVVYNGHSRDGGGPDFCPPVRRGDHHVNYDWYQKNRPGIGALTNAMKLAKESGNPNSVVGMFSCSSQLHFLKRLSVANDKSGLILTSRISTFEEMMRDSFAALDSILAQRCAEGFEKSFDTRGTAHWFNMFKKD